MTSFLTRSALVAGAVAVATATAVIGPAAAQSRERGGVSITIRKAPSYLNTRTVARPNTLASNETSALYQSTTPTRGVSFRRDPLPSSFDLPGY